VFITHDTENFQNHELIDNQKARDVDEIHLDAMIKLDKLDKLENSDTQ